MSVGKKLRELRGSRTQDEISKELGITKSSYAIPVRPKAPLGTTMTAGK